VSAEDQPQHAKKAREGENISKTLLENPLLRLVYRHSRGPKALANGAAFPMRITSLKL
jgi:hypothetical protein